jgi:hypothetical protein
VKDYVKIEDSEGFSSVEPYNTEITLEGKEGKDGKEGEADPEEH